MELLPPAERAIIVAVVVNAIFGAAIGGLAAGVRGAQIGWIAGMVVGLLPLAVRAAAWVVRPEGLVRMVAHELAKAVIAGSNCLAGVIGTWTRPVVRALCAPAFVAGFLSHAAFALALQALGRLARFFATPLAIANAAAIFVIVADFARMEFSSIALFASLPALILVLLVTQSENQ